MRHTLIAPILLFTLPHLLHPQTFTPTGSMREARIEHTATLLNNGTVLATGGWNGSDTSSTAEIFNPATGTWRYTTGSMTRPRYGHSAVKLADGRVLVVGGNQVGVGPPLSSEIFDPVTEQFSAASPMHANKHLSPSILLQDGRVLMIVGSLWFFGVGVSEIYNPVTNSWATTPSIPVGVAVMAGVGLPDGTALAIGGYDGYTPTAYPYVQRYNPSTNTVTAMSDLVLARLHHTATLLPNGKVLIAAGSTASYTTTSTELYDPSVLPNGQSQLGVPLNQGRRAHTATLLPNGDVLAVGGYQSAHGCCFAGVLTSAELRDAVTGAWSLAGQMSVPRAAHTATLLPSGAVLVAGGGYENNGGTPQSTAEIWSRGPVCLEIPIDIKPGSFPNSINLGSGGTVPVAILSTNTFDATGVNPTSITLAGAAVKLKGQGTPQSSTQDINGDARLDLVVHIVTEALQLNSSDTEAVLQGATFGGQCVVGRDTIRVVP